MRADSFDAAGPRGELAEVVPLTGQPPAVITQLAVVEQGRRVIEDLLGERRRADSTPPISGVVEQLHEQWRARTCAAAVVNIAEGLRATRSGGRGEGHDRSDRPPRAARGRAESPSRWPRTPRLAPRHAMINHSARGVRSTVYSG